MSWSIALPSRAPLELAAKQTSGGGLTHESRWLPMHVDQQEEPEEAFAPVTEDPYDSFELATEDPYELPVEFEQETQDEVPQPQTPATPGNPTMAQGARSLSGEALPPQCKVEPQPETSGQSKDAEQQKDSGWVARGKHTREVGESEVVEACKSAMQELKDGGQSAHGEEEG